MALTNHERVGKALELRGGRLAPCVERELARHCRDGARIESLSYN